MDDIDSKFDKFISNYSTDMKLLFEKLSLNQLNYEKRESLDFCTSLPNDNLQIKFYDSSNQQIQSRDLLKSSAYRQTNSYLKNNRLTKNISHSSIDEEKLCEIAQGSGLDDKDKAELMRFDRFKRPRSFRNQSIKIANNNERRLSTVTTTNSIDEIGYYDIYEYENDDDYIDYEDEEDNDESEESLKRQNTSISSSSPKNIIKFNRNSTVISPLNNTSTSINNYNKKMSKKLSNECKSHKNLISILFHDNFRKKQKRKREAKLSMKKYLLNAIQHNNTFNDNKLPKKFKSDTELSLLGIKPFNDKLNNLNNNLTPLTTTTTPATTATATPNSKFNFKTLKNNKKTHLEIFKEDSTNFKIKNPKTNLFNFLSKSDIVNKGPLNNDNNNNNVKGVNSNTSNKHGFVNFKLFGKFNLFKSPHKDADTEIPVYNKDSNSKPRSRSSFNCLEVNETEAMIKPNQSDAGFMEKSKSEKNLYLT